MDNTGISTPSMWVRVLHAGQNKEFCHVNRMDQAAHQSQASGTV